MMFCPTHRIFHWVEWQVLSAHMPRSIIPRSLTSLSFMVCQALSTLDTTPHPNRCPASTPRQAVAQDIPRCHRVPRALSSEAWETARR